MFLSLADKGLIWRVFVYVSAEEGVPGVVESGVCV
jgi:hypothetical protein